MIDYFGEISLYYYNTIGEIIDELRYLILDENEDEDILSISDEEVSDRLNNNSIRIKIYKFGEEQPFTELCADDDFQKWLSDLIDIEDTPVKENLITKFKVFEKKSSKYILVICSSDNFPIMKYFDDLIGVYQCVCNELVYNDLDIEDFKNDPYSSIEERITENETDYHLFVNGEELPTISLFVDGDDGEWDKFEKFCFGEVEKGISESFNGFYEESENLIDLDLNDDMRNVLLDLTDDGFEYNISHKSSGIIEVSILKYPIQVFDIKTIKDCIIRLCSYMKDKLYLSTVEVHNSRLLDDLRVDFFQITFYPKRYITALYPDKVKLLKQESIMNEGKNKFPNIKKLDIDGFNVYVGRDADSNDHLTFNMAHPEDYWMHVKGHPGSHVIIRVKDRIPTKEVLRAAAQLAVKNSKSSKGDVVVIYCKQKFVKKEKGMNPGQVKVDSKNAEEIVISN